MGTNLRGNLLFQTEYENGEQPRGRVPGFILPLPQRKAALAAVLKNGRKGRCCNVQAKKAPSESDVHSPGPGDGQESDSTELLAVGD